MRKNNPSLTWQGALQAAASFLHAGSESDKISLFVSVVDEPPEYHPHNSTFEITERVLIADASMGVRSGYIRRYIMDVRSPSFTANTGDLFFTTETDEMLSNVVGWAPMPEL